MNYLIIPDPAAYNPHDYPNDPAWADSREAAWDIAYDRSADDLRPYLVFSWEGTVENYATSIPMEEEYQVKPGRDFPGSL